MPDCVGLLIPTKRLAPSALYKGRNLVKVVMSVLGMFKVIFGIFAVDDGSNLYAWYVIPEEVTVSITRNWLTKPRKLLPKADDESASTVTGLEKVASK